MSDFLAMGGYAQFVWPAYLATLLGLAGAVVLTLRAYRQAQRTLAALDGNQT
jgi:heme exporter protein D